MGVKGLFQFLKRFEKDVEIAKFIKNKSIGLDIFWFLHLSKGDLFTLQNYLLPLIRNAKEIYCVFDGRPSKEKLSVLKEQAEKRQKIIQSIAEIEKFIKYPFTKLSNQDRYYINQYLHQLKKQAWTPPPEYVDYVKNWLSNKGCYICQAEEEADDELVCLEKNGNIEIIITNDSDLLALGSNNVLRLYSPTKGKLFSRKELLEKMEFTEQMWSDFMYLCKNMKSTDINLAFSLISVYKDLDMALQKSYILYNDYLIITDNDSAKNMEYV